MPPKRPPGNVKFEKGVRKMEKELKTETTKKTKEKDADLPLVVCDENGAFLFLYATNRKGYTKSLEQGALWISHPDTDRILPTGNEAKLKLIEDRGSYFYAEVMLGGGSAQNPEVPEETPAGKAPKPSSRSRKRVSVQDLEILADLTALIAQRRKEKPEGSYTTHLFQSGTDKIRKKTGEEAVELILARTKGEVIYEAADLIYHFLVLLEAEGIGLPAVLQELKSRK
jgi:phosphoribosyl-ATP pyrophosphohydrolase